MKEDDFKSGDRRDGGRPAPGRRDDARRDNSAGSRPFNRDEDRSRPTRSGPTSNRSDNERPRRDVDRRDTNASPRPFNRDQTRPTSDSRRDDNRPNGGSADRPDRADGDAANRPRDRFNSDDRSRPASDRADGDAANRPNRRFDRDNNAGSADRRSDSPRRDDNRTTGSASRFGNNPERREEYPRPKFNRDNNRPDERPRYNDRSAPRFDRDAPVRRVDTDRDVEPRNREPRAERAERPADDSRQRSGENRFGQERQYNERRNRADEPAAPRENTARPYNRDERDGRSADAGPRNDRGRETDRNTSPRREDDRPRSFDRNAGAGPRNERSGSKPRFDTDRRSGSSYSSPAPRFPRRDDTDSTPRRSGPSSEDRRVGKYDRAPRYDKETMRNSIPQRKRDELDRAEKHDDGTIRLNRYIANAGICSRREADELIARGDVQVNGKVVTEMGHKVQPGDVVKYGNRILNPEKMVYVLLNKPKDYITTTDDPEERRTVMELVADAGPFRIYPVGRLDRNTTGLMLMTNDGELAEKLTHPSNGIRKIYQVELDKPISDEHFEAIQRGVELEDGVIKPDAVSIVTPDAQVVGIEIHSGRNRIVRRIFENFGYEVTKLDRTSYAGLTKKELPRGKWRFLEPKEVIKLKYLQ